MLIQSGFRFTRGLGGRGHGRNATFFLGCSCPFHPFHQEVTASAQGGSQTHEGQGREAGNQGKTHQQGTTDHQSLGLVSQLGTDFITKVFGIFVGYPGNNDTGGDGDQQGWNLRDQSVTDGQNGVQLQCFATRHTLAGTDGDAGGDVDEDDDQAGDGITLNELHGTVHRTEQLALFGHQFTASLSFFHLDRAGTQVGIDTHLLAGHTIEREAGADFGNPFRTFGDHQKLNDGYDQEDNHTDGQTAADHEVAEGVDNFTGVSL